MLVTRGSDSADVAADGVVLALRNRAGALTTAQQVRVGHNNVRWRCLRAAPGTSSVSASVIAHGCGQHARLIAQKAPIIRNRAVFAVSKELRVLAVGMVDKHIALKKLPLVHLL